MQCNFACKLRGNKTNGICAIRDDLRSVLEKIHQEKVRFDRHGEPKYYAGMFSEAHKAEHRDKQFPIDLQNAYELGKRLCQ